MYLVSENIDDKIIFEIGKFTILWNMFERECKCNASTENIKEYLYDKVNKYDDKIFGDFVKTIKERAKKSCGGDNYLNTYILTKLYPTDDNRARVGRNEKKEEVPIVQKFFINSNKENMVGAFLAIKRIRNNMFHGLKEQFFLEFFESINAVLQKILEY